jgi:surfactin synthase thioesterase subunit
MGELVDAVAESLWSHCRRPYAFFGHSMGALVAYESALAIQRLGGAPPDLLIVSGCAAPQAFRLQRRLHHLPSDELWQEVGRLGGVAPEVLKNPELLELLEPALRADFELCDSYRPSAPLERIESDIHAFVGEADPWVEEASVRAWQRSTLGAFSLEVMPGGHFSLYDASLAFPRRIQQALQTVSEGRAVVRD